MISGGLCGGESSQDLAMMLFTIIVAVASVFAIAVFVYFAWSAIAALYGVILTLNAGISVLDICIILLSLAGAIFSIFEAGNVGKSTYNFLSNPSVENGQEILWKALEAGAMVLIFEVALPRLMASVSTKFNVNETKLYEYVTKKWGGKKIKTPDTKPGIDPDVDPDPKPGIDPDVNPNVDPDVNPDVDPNMGSGESPKTNNNVIDDIAKKYGDDIADKFESFGENGQKMAEKYGDELADIISGMSEKDAKQALELVNEYGDDAFNSLRNGNSVQYTNAVLKYGECSQEFSNWDSMKDYFRGKITNFKKECKPKGSPDSKKWFEKLGTIKIEIEKGHITWNYSNFTGDKVPYVDGKINFPREYMHPDDDIF